MIENNITVAKQDTTEAVVELEEVCGSIISISPSFTFVIEFNNFLIFFNISSVQAHNYQKESRKRMCCVVVILTVILAALGLIFGVVGPGLIKN